MNNAKALQDAYSKAMLVELYDAGFDVCQENRAILAGYLIENDHLVGNGSVTVEVKNAIAGCKHRLIRA